MNDTQSLIGKIIDSEQERDAIHIAVAPITARTLLMPGDHVGADGTHISPVGIVDPYLKKSVKEGERFWLFLYPNTITSLRHDWAHAAFAAAEPKSENARLSESWLRAKAVSWGIEYDYLMEQVPKGVVCFGHDDGPDYAAGSEKDLQFHAQVVLARALPEPYFRCAC